MKKRTLFQKIIIITCGFHLFLLLLMAVSYRKPKKIQPEPLLVQTVQLKPPPPPPPRAKPRPKTIAKTQPKPRLKKRPPTPIKKSTPAKKRPVAKKRTPPPKPEKTKEILEQLDKSFAQLESKSKPLTLPKKIEVVKTKQRFEEVLAATLQSELILPEIGNVQVCLAVNDEGKISIIEFLIVESEINRKYIEKKLSTISLPSPKLSTFEKTKESYILTFTNRERS